MRPDQRKAILSETLNGQLAVGGRMESRGDFGAVIASGRPPNRNLHLTLAILTVGLWGVLVWLPLIRLGGERRRMLTVDEDGNVGSVDL